MQGLKDYYNSVGSFEGQWYLFVADANANDTYIVHGLLKNLIGTDIKKVSSSDNPDLGEEIAAATEAGIWVKYLWPHPLTLQDAPKVAYAKRYGGLVFASGYYPVEDPRTRTKEYVADAIAYYDDKGPDATVAYYNSPASIDGEQLLLMVDADYKIIAQALFPNLVGMDYSVFGMLIPDFPTVDDIAKVTGEGQWFEYSYLNLNTAEDDLFHLWAVRHDGVLFAAGYSTSQ